MAVNERGVRHYAGMMPDAIRPICAVGHVAEPSRRSAVGMKLGGGQSLSYVGCIHHGHQTVTQIEIAIPRALATAFCRRSTIL